MPQTKSFKVFNQFTKGLITEASPLTYPPDATSDESNLVLFKKGNRTRRYGIDYVNTGSLGVAQSGFTSLAVSEYRWIAAANLSGSNFVCLQIGKFLHFCAPDLSFNSSIDLTTFIISGATSGQVAGAQVQMTSGNGFLFVAGPYTDPFVVSWNGVNTFTATKLFVLIRDFVGLDDGLGPDVQPGSLTDAHHYNLFNQGWCSTGGGGNTVTYWTSFGQQSTYVQGGDGLITDYNTNVHAYPGNNKLWWWGVDSNNGLSSNKLANIAAGASRAPNGHYIVNAFSIDRSAVSGIAGFTVESLNTRPAAVSFFAGRVWWGCNQTVYYSQVLDYNKYYKANFCCQEADPTSQQISDLIATDGGTILLADIGTITRLYPVGSGMLVFGTNGVQFIQGSTGGFSATDFSLSKMSPIGMNSPFSVVEVDSNIFWMSYVGIQGMSYKNGIFGPIQGNFDKLNISLDTIQTFYNVNIPAGVRQNVKAIYDPSDNTIRWLFRSASVNGSYYYDSVLNLDMYLQAFYPWKFSTPGTTGPFIVGVFEALNATNITVGSITRPTQTTYIAVMPNGSNFDLAFCQLTKTSFVDWPAVSTTNGFSSYLETGYDILEDATRKKWLPWIYVHFRRTEQNLSTSDSGVTWVADFPSSCTMTAKWDFSDSTVSGKWSTPKEVYRLGRIPTINGASSPVALDTGFAVVVSKNKVRGNGRAIQLRFENSTIGSDFDLLGWGTEFTGNVLP